LQIVLQYHEQTKHHYHRFARSLGYLDWDTQPDPFRRFNGAELIRLPLLAQQAAPGYFDLFRLNSISPSPVNLNTISRLFRNSLAISAWKRYQTAHWSLRVNPSSGNLHPTEGYLILDNAIPEISAGVYHYAPREHALERRAKFSPETCSLLSSGFPEGTFFVGLTSIHWREAWKYGERAFRYCQHDIGHALAALRLSGALLGWKMILLEELSDDDIAVLLGLNRAQDFEEAEDEFPDFIAAVIPSRHFLHSEGSISDSAIKAVFSSSWYGHANRLSSSHVEWEIIEEVSVATHKLRNQIQDTRAGSVAQNYLELKQEALSAEKIIQQRRSAVAMDGVTELSREWFYRMMLRILPDATSIPFDAFSRSLLNSPRIHIAIFVNRVKDISPGL
jgi:SagB-type dehydrogenase family enzyme